MIKSALRHCGPAIAILASILAGCAAPARVEQMQVDSSLATRSSIASQELKENIAIKDVTGGKDTNPMWVSNVSSSDFERALEASLRNAGLLSPNRQGSKYTLVAHMLQLEQPFLGASMTVTATVQYTLIERASGKEVFTKSLATPYTAAFSDAFLGTERLKLANEGAVRTNIQQLISSLVELRIASGSL